MSRLAAALSPVADSLLSVRVSDRDRAYQVLLSGEETHVDVESAVSPLVYHAAQALIALDDKGVKTDLSFGGAPSDVLASLSLALSDLRIPHAQGAALISALGGYVSDIGFSFASKAGAKPLYIRLMVTDRPPQDLPDCEVYSLSMLDGTRAAGSDFSQMVVQSTIFGTRSSMTVQNDLYQYFQSGKKKWVLVYFGAHKIGDTRQVDQHLHIAAANAGGAGMAAPVAAGDSGGDAKATPSSAPDAAAPLVSSPALLTPANYNAPVSAVDTVAAVPLADTTVVSSAVPAPVNMGQAPVLTAPPSHNDNAPVAEPVSANIMASSLSSDAPGPAATVASVAPSAATPVLASPVSPVVASSAVAGTPAVSSMDSPAVAVSTLPVSPALVTASPVLTSVSAPAPAVSTNGMPPSSPTVNASPILAAADPSVPAAPAVPVISAPVVSVSDTVLSSVSPAASASPPSVVPPVLSASSSAPSVMPVVASPAVASVSVVPAAPTAVSVAAPSVSVPVLSSPTGVGGVSPTPASAPVLPVSVSSKAAFTQAAPVLPMSSLVSSPATASARPAPVVSAAPASPVVATSPSVPVSQPPHVPALIAAPGVVASSNAAPVAVVVSPRTDGTVHAPVNRAAPAPAPQPVVTTSAPVQTSSASKPAPATSHVSPRVTPAEASPVRAPVMPSAPLPTSAPIQTLPVSQPTGQAAAPVQPSYQPQELGKPQEVAYSKPDTTTVARAQPDPQKPASPSADKKPENRMQNSDNPIDIPDVKNDFKKSCCSDESNCGTELCPMAKAAKEISSQTGGSGKGSKYAPPKLAR